MVYDFKPSVLFNNSLVAKKWKKKALKGSKIWIEHYRTIKGQVNQRIQLKHVQ